MSFWPQNCGQNFSSMTCWVKTNKCLKLHIKKHVRILKITATLLNSLIKLTSNRASLSRHVTKFLCFELWCSVMRDENNFLLFYAVQCEVALCENWVFLRKLFWRALLEFVWVLNSYNCSIILVLTGFYCD